VRIVLIGATGLIGAKVARRLAGHQLHCLQRRPGGSAGDVHVAPAEQWPALVRQLKPEVVISALGTTMRTAGSQAAFRAVDRDTVAAVAEAARTTGAGRMISVSSVGADPRSRNFYLRTKGETEQTLGELGFDRLDLFRPGLLRGDRAGDRRLGERLGLALSPLANLMLRGRLDRYAAIDAETVAEAMVATLSLPPLGRHIHHNRAIRALARR
jgi:uncharacterized protein YbjT (DUF2867 family)